MKLAYLNAVAFSLFFLSGHSFAQTSGQLLSQLDFNDDKFLSTIEVQAGLLHSLRKARGTDVQSLLQTYRSKALQNRGVLKKSELGATGDETFALTIMYEQLQSRRTLGKSERFRFSKFNPQDDFSLSEVYEIGVSESERKMREFKQEKGRFLLRRNLENRNEKPNESDIAALTKGVLLGFSRNNEANTDQVLARGAVIWTLPTVREELYEGQRGRLVAKDFYAYGAIDKVDTSGGDDGEVDSVSVGLGLSRTWRPNSQSELRGRTPSERFAEIERTEGRGLNQFKLDGRVDFNTDTSFEHQIISGEVDFIPTMTRFGLNSPVGNKKLPFAFSWNLALRLEGGQVIDDGDMEELNEGTFVRAGAKAGVAFYFPKNDFGPFKSNSLALEVSYLHYETLVSDLDSPSYVEAELRWRLDTSENFPTYFTVNYRSGTLDKTLEEDDTITAGIGFAF